MFLWFWIAYFYEKRYYFAKCLGLPKFKCQFAYRILALERHSWLKRHRAKFGHTLVILDNFFSKIRVFLDKMTIVHSLKISTFNRTPAFYVRRYGNLRLIKKLSDLVWCTAPVKESLISIYYFMLVGLWQSSFSLSGI